MTCYTKIIKNLKHEQVVKILKDVVAGDLKQEEAAKKLNLSKHEFDELYEEFCNNVLLVAR